MIGFWNDDEDAALQGLSLEAQIIYLRGIRRFSDKNGVAGIDRRINRASLSEVCHFVPDIGSKKPATRPTWDQVKHRLAELERAGLIIRHENLVFDLPLAVENKSVQMRTARGQPEDGTQSKARTNTPTKPNNANGFNVDDGTCDSPRTARGRHAEDAPTSPVTSHLINNNSNARGNNSIVVPIKRPIPANFEASEKVRSWAAHRFYDRLDEHLDNFIRKCQANGYTYADWDSALMTAIADDWAGLRKTEAQSNSGRGRSNAPNNNDTSWFTDDLLEPAK